MNKVEDKEIVISLPDNYALFIKKNMDFYELFYLYIFKEISKLYKIYPICKLYKFYTIFYGDSHILSHLNIEAVSITKETQALIDKAIYKKLKRKRGGKNAIAFYNFRVGPRCEETGELKLHEARVNLTKLWRQ